MIREWFVEVELTQVPQNHTIVEVVTNTCKGALRQEVEAFLAAQANRNNTPWGLIRQHISAAFMTADENEALRKELEKLRQTSYESPLQYNRRKQQ